MTPWTGAVRLLCPWGFSRQEYWSGLPGPPPGNLPNPGTEPRSPGLQAFSLPSEPPGKPKNTGVGILSKGSSRPRYRTGVSCIAGGFWSWATREAPSSASYPAIPIPGHTQRPRNCCVRPSGWCGNPQLLDHRTAREMLKSTRPRVASRGTTGMLFIFRPQQLVHYFTTGRSILGLRRWRLREARPEVTPPSLPPSVSPRSGTLLPRNSSDVRKKKRWGKGGGHSQGGDLEIDNSFLSSLQLI